MNIRLSHESFFSLRIGLGLFVATVMCFGVAQAADTEPSKVRPASADTDVTKMVSPGDVTATPEMWFYEQAMHRYNDPKVAIRAKEELKADQRRQRIAAMQWYGYSNSRPASGIDVNHGPAQAQWTGNGSNTAYWVQPSRSVVWMVPGAPRGY
jgi:hypothetical protein